ncbi:zinc finger and BTB domain-containing protein 25 [Stigmatopora nigra]
METPLAPSALSALSALSAPAAPSAAVAGSVPSSAHSLLLLQQLNVQREFGFLCDCTVAIGNVYFKAHRAVLAAFSNYFKMIFIHQSSECIKIQPADIQPDVFSYLLHVMYTGACPRQAVEPARLEDGIKFLHAHQLCRRGAEGAPGVGPPAPDCGPDADAARASNLYGIQISSQLAGKEGGRPQPSPEGRAPSPPARDRGVAIKQERPDGDVPDGHGPGSPPKDRVPAPGLRGHHCASPERLRRHLFGHALHPALFAPECPPEREVGGGSEDERPDAERLEEALRQSRALAAQLAVELRRSREGGAAAAAAAGAASDPVAVAAAAASGHSRKRKMACAVCGVRFSHKSQLQEHMYAHTAKPPRLHRHSQLFHSSAHLCPEGGGAPADDAFPDTRDNGSSAYSLDSEISQGSGDGGRGE